MKIGNAEVCDLCGASWTPHTDDCDFAGSQGPMVEMAVVAQSALAQQLELVIHKDWSSANWVSKTASLSLPMPEPEEFDTDDAEAEGDGGFRMLSGRRRFPFAWKWEE